MKPEFKSIDLNKEVYITLNPGSLLEQKLGQDIAGKVTGFKSDFLSKKSALHQFYISQNLHNQKVDLWLLQDQFGNTWELPYQDIAGVTYIKQS